MFALGFRPEGKSCSALFESLCCGGDSASYSFFSIFDWNELVELFIFGVCNLGVTRQRCSTVMVAEMRRGMR